MQRFRFKKGLRFIDGGKQWTLKRELATKKLELSNEDGGLLQLSKDELLSRWYSGNWNVDPSCLEEINDVIYMAEPRDLQSFGKAQQTEAARRAAYLIELSEYPFNAVPQTLQERIYEIAKKLNDTKPPHWTTVYRWRGKYAQSKNITKLVDGRSRSGRRTNEGAFKEFEKTIETVYLTTQQRPKIEVYNQLLLDVEAKNKIAPPEQQLVMPSKQTIYRWLANLHQHCVDTARLGKEAADLKYKSSIGGVKALRILERVEIDHTPLDLILIDDDTKVSLGRPWLTLAIDRFSRAILGFYLSFHAPSSYSVMHCLRKCILPKNRLLDEYADIKNSWPMHGIPMEVVFDNGMDLHAKAVAMICAEMGIRISYCPTGEPYFKGAIERMFGTLNKGLIHQLPGTTYSNTNERGNYSSEQEAVFGINQAVHLITKWIVDVYHQRKHRITGRSPHQLWIDQITNTVIELPADPRILDILVGIPAEGRRITNEGIQFETLFYNNADLQFLRRRIGARAKVSFKYFEHDISYIQVWDDEREEYVRVEVTERYAAYASGLTRQLHLVTRRYGEVTYGKEWADTAPLKAKQEIQKLVALARKSKKMAIRKKAAAIDGLTKYSSNQGLAALEFALEPRQVQKLAPPEPIDSGENDELPKFEVVKQMTRGVFINDLSRNGVN